MSGPLPPPSSPSPHDRWNQIPGLAALLVNGRLASCHSVVPDDATVVPVTLSQRWGHRIYRRTAGLMLELARRKAAPEIQWHAGPSWGGSYEYVSTSEQPVADKVIDALNATLAEWARQDRPLKTRMVPWTVAVDTLDPQHDEEALRWIRQRNPAEVRCLEWEGQRIWAPEVLLPSSGPLSAVKVASAPEGLLLQLPQKSWPLQPASWVVSESLRAVHCRQLRWSRAQDATSLTKMNALCADRRQLESFIQGAEAVHERDLADLADKIVDRGASIVLLAGPSSSGKTTTSKRLAVQLQALGHRPLALSLDNYFVDRDKTPLDSDGRPDFEALEALDRTSLSTDLGRLLAHETVELPVYDFKTGRRKDQGQPFRLGAGGVLILEGIHALNPALCEDQRDSVYSIFVSAMTPLSWDGRMRASSSDHRLLRRLVRDYQFRGYSALQTLRQWPSVRRGEETRIFPFQDRADGVFNSSLPYEVHALRELALPLLEAVSPREPEYAQARDLHTFLEGITPLPVRLVPTFSLLREFVGQSGFHY